MSKLFSSFVVGVVLVTTICCVSSTAMMTHSSNVYKTIENHLYKFAKNIDDCDSVIAEANDWLAILKKGRASSQIAASEEEYEELIDCLEKFTALGSLVADKRCDQHSYTIRTITDEVYEWRLIAMNTYKNTIETLALKHATVCQTVFPQRYHAKLGSLNETLIHRLEVVLNDVVMVNAIHDSAQEWTLGQLSKIDMLALLKNENERRGLFRGLILRPRNLFELTEDVEIVYKAIEVLAKEDEDQDFVSQTMKKVGERYVIEDVERVLKRYVLDPCSYFYAQLGPNIFSPAFQDVWLLEEGGIAPLTDENLSDYYFSWAKYRVCENLLQSRDLQQRYLANNIKRLSLKAMNPYFS